MLGRCVALEELKCLRVDEEGPSESYFGEVELCLDLDEETSGLDWEGRRLGSPLGWP
jgi:hypothetical protein